MKKNGSDSIHFPNYTGERGLGSFLGLAIILLALPLFLDPYTLKEMIIKLLIFSIFAMSYNIAFGYAGLASLGHAAFFGSGGYVVGLLALHADSLLFWIGLPLGILVAAAIAALFGLIALRARGLYFLLITFALGQLLYSLAWNVKWMSSPGMQGIAGLDLPDFGFADWYISDLQFYFLVLAFFYLTLFLLYRLVNSTFGVSLLGIRENERRMAATGYNVWAHKYVAFVVSGAFAGLAGSLYAYYKGMIHPTDIGIDTSFLPMVMAIIGGQSTLLGPVIGAVIVILVQYYVSNIMPIRWPLVLGGLFVFSIMFARQGVWVYLTVLWNKVVWRHGSTKG